MSRPARPPNRPTDRLIDDLASALQPVRRPVAAQRAFWPWLGLVGSLGLGATSTMGRADLGAQLARGPYLLTMALWAGLAIGAAHAALRLATPGDGPRLRGWMGVAAAGIVTWTLLAVLPVQPAEFMQVGIAAWGCAERTILLAALPLGMLLAAIGSGAPLAPRVTAATAAMAATAVAFVVMRTLCAVDEPLHVLTWHLLPSFVLIGITCGMGGAWIGRWRRGAAR